jgi:hypothetical protein
VFVVALLVMAADWLFINATPRRLECLLPNLALSPGLCRLKQPTGFLAYGGRRADPRV